MNIRPLPDDPAIIAALSAWHVAEWAHLFEGWDEASCAHELRQSVDGEIVPRTWILEDEDGLQGSVSLIALDADELSDVAGPWLASLYLRPQVRRRGYGQALVREVMRHAVAMGLPRISLFTPHHADFYAALGWRHVAARTVQGEAVQVMAFEPDLSGATHD